MSRFMILATIAALLISVAGAGYVGASATDAPQPQACLQIPAPGEIPSPSLIRFDDLSNGSIIGNSYQASHGVRFESGDSVATIRADRSPQSPPNVAANIPARGSASNNVPMRIFFDTPKTHVGMYIGNGSTDQMSAVLTAYNANGGAICQVQISKVPLPHTAFLGIADPTGSIASVGLDYGNTSLFESIDDLYFTFNVPPTPTRTATRTTTPTPTPTFVMPPLVAMPYKPLVKFGPNLFIGDLSIFGIEITQGIQCFDTSKGLAGCADNSLAVVAKKDATARIYLRFSGAAGSMANVPVRLHIFANGVEYLANTSGKATAAIDQSKTDSANVYFNVNFANDVAVSFYAEVDPDHTITETNEGNNRYPASGTLSYSFRKRDVLKTVGWRLRYHPSGYAGEQYAGGWAVNGGAADWWEQLLPIRNNGINYVLKSGYLNWTTSLGSGDGQHALISYLNLEWMKENLFSWIFGTGTLTGAQHVYGWAPNAGYSGGHADMPIYPHAGGLGVVGIGTDRPGTSTDNPGGGAYIFGHELTHDYDVLHTNVAGDCGSTDGNSNFPYSSASIQEFGFNPVTGKIYDPASTHDLMSYCPAGGSKQGWISPFTWSRVFGGLATTALNAAAASPQQPNVGLLYETTAAQSLLVNATIFNPAMQPARAGQLGDLVRIDGGLAYETLQGDYAIQLRQGNTILAQRTFTLTFQSEYAGHGGTHPEGSDEPPPFPPEPSAQADVAFIMPWADGADSVALVHNGEVLDQRRVSAHAPSVLITSPTVAITWPAGSTQTITWRGSDADGDALVYSLLYSNDGGANWVLLADHLTKPEYSLPVDSLAGGANARFRVVANDGLDIGSDETDAPINVPDQAPFPIIGNPTSGQVFAPGDLVVLQGSATDMEDGSLPEGSLAWSSDRQGALGLGPSLPVNTLQPGRHVITLAATDSAGHTVTATTAILIGWSTVLPVIVR